MACGLTKSIARPGVSLSPVDNELAEFHESARLALSGLLFCKFQCLKTL